MTEEKRAGEDDLKKLRAWSQRVGIFAGLILLALGAHAPDFLSVLDVVIGALLVVTHVEVRR